MKAKFYLLPAITLTLASIWLIKQRQSISSVEKTSTQFEKQIAAVRSPSPVADLTRMAPASLAVKEGTAEATAQTDKQPLDWKNIAALCETFQQNYDGREMIRLEQRFDLMSPAERVAALEEVATLGLSAGANRLLMNSHATNCLTPPDNPQSSIHSSPQRSVFVRSPALHGVFMWLQDTLKV